MDEAGLHWDAEDFVQGQGGGRPLAPPVSEYNKKSEKLGNGKAVGCNTLPHVQQQTVSW
jgi:hypothetical protein